MKPIDPNYGGYTYNGLDYVLSGTVVVTARSGYSSNEVVVNGQRGCGSFCTAVTGDNAIGNLLASLPATTPTPLPVEQEVTVTGQRKPQAGNGTQITQNQSKKSECIKECLWILDRPETRPGSDRNTWDFHKCVNVCMARDPNSLSRTVPSNTKVSNQALSWFGAVLAGTAVIIGGVAYFIVTTF